MQRISALMRPMICAGALAAIVAAPVTMHAQGRTRVPLVYFGMSGIVRGESARLSVSNVPQPNSGFPPGPCKVTISFVDGSGNTLVGSDGHPVTRTVTLQPGQSAFLQISADDFLRAGDAVEATGGGGAGRLNFRPVVSVQPSRAGEFPPGPCIPSLEVLDTASLQTKFVLPGVASSAITTNHNETLVIDAGY